MNALAAAGVGLLGLALMLAWALWRQRRRNAALQRRLDLADTELQQLQQACARLAPAGVVDRMLADGLRGGAAELLPLLQARAEAIPLASASVDLLSMGYALRHVPDLLHAFAEFHHAYSGECGDDDAGDHSAGRYPPGHTTMVPDPG